MAGGATFVGWQLARRGVAGRATYSGQLAKCPPFFVDTMRLFRLILLLALLGWAGQASAQCSDYRLTRDSKDGLYGAVDRQTKQVVIPYRFTFALDFPGNYLLVTDKNQDKETRWGLAGAGGELVLPKKYRAIYAPECGLLAARDDQTTTLFDSQLKVLYQADVTRLFTARKNNRIITERQVEERLAEVKLVDFTTHRVYFQRLAQFIWPVFSLRLPTSTVRQPMPFYEVRYAGPNRTAGDLSSIIDVDGKIRFDSVHSLDISGNFTRMFRRGKVIIADSNLVVNQALSYRYEVVQPLTNPARWLMVMQNGKSGVLDLKGRFVIQPTQNGSFTYLGRKSFYFHSNEPGQPSQIVLADGRRISMADQSIVATTGLDSLQMSRPLVVRNTKTHKSGLMATDGHFILPQEYDALRYGTHGKLIFIKNGISSGYLNQQGEVLFSGSYFGLSSFLDGLAVVADRAYGRGYPGAMITSGIDQPSYATLYTFIDSTGKAFPGGYYEQVSAFRDGMARVMRNGQEFMIDRQGTRLSYGKYLLASHFRDDVALITTKKHDRFGLVHRSGKILAEPIYDRIATDNGHPAPYNTVIFYTNAYTTNVLPFILPRVEQGKVEATLINQKNYGEQKVMLSILP